MKSRKFLKASPSRSRINPSISILKKPKDIISDEASKGVIYRSNAECSSVYTGQNSCSLKTSVKEYAKAIATLDKHSQLAQITCFT